MTRETHPWPSSFVHSFVRSFVRLACWRAAENCEICSINFLAKKWCHSCFSFFFPSPAARPPRRLRCSPLSFFPSSRTTKCQRFFFHAWFYACRRFLSFTRPFPFPCPLSRRVTPALQKTPFVRRRPGRLRTRSPQPPVLLESCSQRNEAITERSLGMNESNEEKKRCLRVREERQERWRRQRRRRQE